MSIFRVSSSINPFFDYRDVQSLDVMVNNIGDKGFELLLEAYGPNGLIIMTLIGLGSRGKANSSAAIREIVTEFAPFDMQLVTNITNPHTVDITVEVKNRGIILTQFTHQQFTTIR